MVAGVTKIPLVQMPGALAWRVVPAGMLIALPTFPPPKPVWSVMLIVEEKLPRESLARILETLRAEVLDGLPGEWSFRVVRDDGSGTALFSSAKEP